MVHGWLPSNLTSKLKEGLQHINWTKLNWPATSRPSCTTRLVVALVAETRCWCSTSAGHWARVFNETMFTLGVREWEFSSVQFTCCEQALTCCSTHVSPSRVTTVDSASSGRWPVSCRIIGRRQRRQWSFPVREASTSALIETRRRQRSNQPRPSYTDRAAAIVWQTGISRTTTWPMSQLDCRQQHIRPRVTPSRGKNVQ